MSKVHEALRRAEREREEARRAAGEAAPAAAAVAAGLPAAGVEAHVPPVAPPAPPVERAAPPVYAPLPPAPPARDAAVGEPAARPRRALPERSRAGVDLRLSDALVAFTKPRSMAAEQYRAIRQQIAAFGRTTKIRTIVVTSPLAGEGKTTTASNLGIALGQDLGRRVCLVDCDLRNPGVGALFGLPPRDGLADVLRRRASLDAVLVPTPVNDLWVIPAGHLPPNPAELLGSREMRDVVTDLEERFDLVVLDSPPVLPIPDPAILSGLADGVVVVLLAGKTPRRLIDRTLDRLHGALLLGFVLNKTDEYRYYAEYYAYDYGA
jgi:capsular exopolysaccharide synthesis family protein